MVCAALQISCRHDQAIHACRTSKQHLYSLRIVATDVGCILCRASAAKPSQTYSECAFGLTMADANKGADVDLAAAMIGCQDSVVNRTLL